MMAACKVKIEYKADGLTRSKLGSVFGMGRSFALIFRTEARPACEIRVNSWRKGQEAVVGFLGAFRCFSMVAIKNRSRRTRGNQTTAM